MKRYLIEPEFVTTHALDGKTAPGYDRPATRHRIVYRIMDTATRQMTTPASEDIDAVASTCSQLNLAHEKTARNASHGDQLQSSEPASSLPEEIIQSIAISNAKSIGEQTAVLANLALAQPVINQNMQQQIAISYQQAMSQITMSVAARCVAMVEGADRHDQAAVEEVAAALEKLTRQLALILDGKVASDPCGQP